MKEKLFSNVDSAQVAVPGVGSIDSKMFFANEGQESHFDAVGEGAGSIGRETVTSNLGHVLDVTPSAKHTTTTKNPGYIGGPNSSVDRWYGSDGKAIRDVDYSQHGNPKQHPEAPHEHYMVQ